MWYVIQTFTGREEEVRKLCRKQIPEEILADCFIPYYEELKKYKGSWHKERRVLFPGYIFCITDRVDDLSSTLSSVTVFTRLLGSEDYIIPLTREEIAFLLRFGGDDRLVGLSTGIIENDKVTITAGPLLGMEGCIRYINRHKRQVRVELQLFRRTMEVTVGLEIVSKKIG